MIKIILFTFVSYETKEITHDYAPLMIISIHTIYYSVVFGKTLVKNDIN
jgi:hypothetical protein